MWSAETRTVLRLGSWSVGAFVGWFAVGWWPKKYHYGFVASSQLYLSLSKFISGLSRLYLSMEIRLSPPHFALTHGYLTAAISWLSHGYLTARSRLSHGYPQQRHPLWFAASPPLLFFVALESTPRISLPRVPGVPCGGGSGARFFLLVWGVSVRPSEGLRLGYY